MREWGQFGEVAAIWPIFKDQKEGFYLDVGAHDGVTDSNTIQLDRLGWEGICIEPHNVYFPRLVRNRPRAVSIKVAAWSKNEEDLDFYATAPGGWSRVGSPGEIAVVAIYKVQGRTLDSILEEFLIEGPIDFLSLDVEGNENEVLKGFDLKKWRPRIVIIEDLSLKGQFNALFSLFGYRSVASWEQGIGGSNVIYCREIADWKIVKERWK